MNKLKELKRRLNLVREKLDLINYKNEFTEIDKEERKINWIINNH